MFMKTKILNLLLLIIAITNVNAQQTNKAFCHTLPDIGTFGQVVNRGGTPTYPPCTKVRVNLFFHFMHYDNGEGGLINGNKISITDLNNKILPFYINAPYQNIPNNVKNIEFNILGMEDVNSTFIYEKYGKSNILQSVGNVAMNRQPNAINIYVFGDDSYYGGDARASNPGTYILCGGKRNGQHFITTPLLAHEIGHCLGLYHTFHGTSCDPSEAGVPELVNGSNALTAGDLVADTPADPSNYGVQDGTNGCYDPLTSNTYGPWNYGHNGNCRGHNDAMGKPYDPLKNNIMDYIPETCMDMNGNGITQGQANRILSIIANDPELLATLDHSTLPNSNISINATANNICRGASPIILTASPASYALYAWDNSSNASNPSANNNSLTVNPDVTTTYIATAYNSNNVCDAVAKASITINVNDGVNLTINGNERICQNGGDITYSILSSGSSNYNIGQWTSSDPSIAFFSTPGVLRPTGTASGTITITYTTTSYNGTSNPHCTVTAKKTVTVSPTNPTLNILDASGGNILLSPVTACSGNAYHLFAGVSDDITKFWWGVNNQKTEELVVYPTQGYTITLYGEHFCMQPNTPAQTSISFNIIPTPTISPIVGVPSTICLSDLNLYQISNAISGGIWNVIGNTIAQPGLVYIDASTANVTLTANGGLVGDCIVQYSITGGNGCVATASSPVYVSAYNLVLTGNNGSNHLCTGQPRTFTANIPGGVWSSDYPNIADVDQNGKVTGVSAGSVTISYTVPASFCGSEIKGNIQLVVALTPSLVSVKNIMSICSPVQPFTFTTNVSGGNWSIVPGLGGNPAVASVDVASGLVTPLKIGTTVITYTPPNWGCLYDPINIQVNVIPCSATIFCNNVSTTEIEGDGSPENNLASFNYQNGLFIIKKDITIPSGSSVTFQNAQIIIEPTIKISVADNAALNIISSHLYGCGGMWQGIEALGDNAKINVSAYSGISSFIEDAQVAISYKPEHTTPDYGTVIPLNISNTIFNRNKISIQINDLADDYNGGDLPINVYNCLFTSRDIKFDPSINVWDNIDAIKNNGTINNYGITPKTYTSPFIKDNLYEDYNGSANLKDGTGKPFAGIVLNNIGTKNSNNIYKNLVIGSKGSYSPFFGIISNTNIFDNLQYGINAENANLIINNCIFQKPVGAGVGISINNPSSVYSGHDQTITQTTTSGHPPVTTTTTYQVPIPIFYNQSVTINKPSGYPSNAFFDMNTAIIINGSKKILIENCDIRSTQKYSEMSESKGFRGIQLQNYNFDNIDINNNNITNIRYPIDYAAAKDRTAWAEESTIGTLNINENIIQPNLTGLINGSNEEYVENAINLSSLYVSGTNILPFTCKRNTIANVQNGIRISNWANKNLVVETNNIKLIANPNNPTDNSFGICLEAGSPNYETGSLGTKVADNTIDGIDMNGYTTGILLNQQTGAKIECNTVSNHQHGFKFVSANPETIFFNNLMKADNLYGFSLSDGGVIGQQGSEVYPVNVGDKNKCTSDNSWEFGSSSWANSGQYMTNCEGSDATLSPLVVFNDPTGVHTELNPDGSGNFIGGSIYPYQHSAVAADNSIIYSVSDAANCPRCTMNGIQQSNYQRQTNDPKILEDIAQGIINLPIDGADERLYVMQQQLYELLQKNPAIAANSTNLQQFILNNQWTSLDFIHFTAYYLAKGDKETVNLLLGFWPNEGAVSDNYYKYYDWMLRMYEDPSWMPKATDVYDLANRCPSRDGLVVYAARNLYNAITKKINKFEVNCGGSAMRGGKPHGFIRLNQPIAKLMVYPNPAKTQINIEFNKIKSVEITDMLGRVISQNQYSGINKVQLNTSELQKGLYLIKVTNIDKVAKIEKLLIE